MAEWTQDTAKKTINILELQLKEGQLTGRVSSSAAGPSMMRVVKELVAQLPNPDGKYGVKYADSTGQNKLVFNAKGLKWVKETASAKLQYQFIFATQALSLDGQPKDASFLPQFAQMLESAAKSLDAGKAELIQLST